MGPTYRALIGPYGSLFPHKVGTGVPHLVLARALRGPDRALIGPYWSLFPHKVGTSDQHLVLDRAQLLASGPTS